MTDLLRLLYTLLVWLPTRPFVAAGDEIAVRMGWKRRVATGRPVWRKR